MAGTMSHSLNEIAEQLALRPALAEAVFQGQSVIPLLALLEQPYTEVSKHFNQALRQAGFCDAQFQNLSLAHFASSVLADSTPYWIDKALGWIEQGFPITEAIIEAIAVVRQAEHLPQSTRHKANQLLDRLANEHYNALVQELVDIAHRAVLADHRPSQILKLIRDGWKAKTNEQFSYVGFVRCVKTAFDIPLRQARELETWNGLSVRGSMLDEDVDRFLQPWIDAYRKRVS